MPSCRRASLPLAASLAVTRAGLTACGSDGGSDPGASGARAEPVTLRLGYFPNVTHATAVAGIEKKIYEEKLGPDTLAVQTFNAGPAAVEALFANGLDATYIGPNPASNAFSKSNGEAIRIISGGASLVEPSINQPSDLKGKKVASPQLGGTQDVALRAWLDGQGLKPDAAEGTTVLPQENAQTLETFKAGGIEGAWVPEPWATRLVQEGDGKVLVDEKTLLITGLQTMPSIAWFPLAVLLFQPSEAAIIFVVVLGAAPSIANGLISGVDQVPPILVRAGRMLGARGPTLFRHVVLPAALPSCVAGLKQGWAFAWRSLMAGELLLILLERPSIGSQLPVARDLSDAPLLIAFMVVVLAVGILIDAAFIVVENRLRRRRGLVETATWTAVPGH